MVSPWLVPRQPHAAKDLSPGVLERTPQSIARSKFLPVDKLHPEDWINDIQWMPATEAVDKIAYDDIGKLILVGMKKVREGKL